MRMINDCMNGKIDMIVTKSISRFARNTLDTLKYVRKLKARNIAVLFESEKINTLTMDGELLLVILSAVAQQEVENTSTYVKRGLMAKMRRGESVGFPYCYGYNYDAKKKVITINKEEAEIVRFIFQRYLEGYGSFRIAKELTHNGIKTRLGKDRWHDSAVKTILKNEKYVGDLLLGKTVTLDPIEKKRVVNNGEFDRYYIKDHHEAIIKRSDFDRVQEICKKRANKTLSDRRSYTKQYPFSYKTKCGLCGKTIVRKSILSNTKHAKIAWGCSNAVKNGKEKCPHSTNHYEELIQSAFVDAYKMICLYKEEAIFELISRIEASFAADDKSFRKAQLKKEIKMLNQQRETAYDMRIKEVVTQDDFIKKYQELGVKAEELSKELIILENREEYQKDTKIRVNKLKAYLEKNNILDEFDDEVFESVVEKIVIGERDEQGEIDPHKICFFLKTGISVKSENRKEVIETVVKEMGTDTLCRVENEIEILCFYHFCHFNEFVKRHGEYKEKRLVDRVKVSVSLDIKTEENFDK